MDDDRVVLAMCSDILTKAGYAVRIAHTLQGFYLATAAWRPEIVMMDVCMPEMPGNELCALVKNSIPGIPVVLFSALPEDHLAALAASCGADAHVEKKPGLAGLAAIVDDLCERIIW